MVEPPLEVKPLPQKFIRRLRPELVFVGHHQVIDEEDKLL